MVLSERRGSAVRVLLAKQDTWDALPHEMSTNKPEQVVQNPHSLTPHEEENEENSSPPQTGVEPVSTDSPSKSGSESPPKRIKKVNKKPTTKTPPATAGEKTKKKKSTGAAKTSPPKLRRRSAQTAV